MTIEIEAGASQSKCGTICWNQALTFSTRELSWETEFWVVVQFEILQGSIGNRLVGNCLHETAQADR
jgi:hypothetical protein